MEGAVEYESICDRMTPSFLGGLRKICPFAIMIVVIVHVLASAVSLADTLVY